MSNSYKKEFWGLIVYWAPFEKLNAYSISLSYKTDFFVKNEKIDIQHPEFPISYIPEGSGPKGKFSGFLFMKPDDYSLNIVLNSPHSVKEQLYPEEPPDPGKPVKNKQDYLMNLEHMEYKNLFPYIYIQPYPNATEQDIVEYFAVCCGDGQTNFNSKFNSCADTNNAFYKKLVELKQSGDRLLMQEESVNFINGYDKNYQPVYVNEYRAVLASLNPFYKNVYELGIELRAKESVTFEELTKSVNGIFGSWDNLSTELNDPVNISERINIVMSYIALIITFGYNFSWMIKLQVTLITVNLLYKSLAYTGTGGDTESVPKPETIHNWIYSTLILPGDIFPLPVIKKEGQETVITEQENKSWVKPYSLGLLRIVRYKLTKYLLGEVSRIENVLKGEIKKVKERKLNINSYESGVNEEDGVTWKQAINESFRGAMNNAGKTLTPVTETTTYNNGKTGASETDGDTSIGGWSVAVDPAGGYQKDSSGFEKEIINKAAELISRRINYSRSYKHTHEHEENIIHRYNNLKGDKDIIGIYRWVNKLYGFKVIEFGNRLMLELFCHNPAEYYLKNEKQYYKLDLDIIKSPEKLGAKSYQNISAVPVVVPAEKSELVSGEEVEPRQFYYLDLLQYYNIAEYPHPLADNISVAKTVYGVFQFEKTNIIIPIEYKPVKAVVEVTFTEKVSEVTVQIGSKQETISSSAPVEFELSIADENLDRLPVTILCKPTEHEVQKTTGAPENLYTAVITVDASLRENIINEWKYQIYILLKRGYEQILREYYEYRLKSVAAENPELNKEIILQQLKFKSTKVILEQSNQVIYGGKIINPSGNNQDVENLVVGEPAYLQFIENGIEWDKITYYLYPEYENTAFYSHHTTERNFNSFLRSKYARILLPVKPSYSYSYLFFLATGYLWAGEDKDTPAVYSNINNYGQLKKIKFPATEEEKDKWEITVPTSMDILQEGSELPEFNGGGK